MSKDQAGIILLRNYVSALIREKIGRHFLFSTSIISVDFLVYDPYFMTLTVVFEFSMKYLLDICLLVSVHTRFSAV